MTSYRNPWARWAALGCLLIMITACKPNPQDDIRYFQAFIQENSHRIAGDPYISSTVRPGDKMYEILVNIQHSKWDLAEQGLLPLIEEENSDAMVWYALMLLLDHNKRREVTHLFYQSLALGNPYAALSLSKGSYACAYLGSGTLSSQVAKSLGIDDPSAQTICTDDYYARAVELFKPLASKGDLRAQYFLLQQKQWEQSTKTREQYLNEVIRFAKAHYYQPLMDYIDTILIRPQGSNKYQSKTPEQYDLAVQLLTIASNNNYIPAINWLENISDSDDRNKLRNRALKLGSISMMSHLYYSYDGLSKESYFYNLLYKKLTGEYKVSWELPSKAIQDEVKIEVDEFLKTITPMVYIDGFTHRRNWVEK
ncbi:sel1 repeat family protein [Vibrio metschnikovii]|nr:sel1 repeat family protein [Vibrio metschnikovii]